MIGGAGGALLASVLGALLGGGAVAVLATGPASERRKTESIVRNYILDNPEILREASERLQERELARAQDQASVAVRAQRAAFQTPFAGAWEGAADADVVLVEFFDYACGYCRKSNADIDRLLKEDSKLKVVWRDWPVLGEDSVLAAQASLAAARAERYRTYYDSLFALGRPTQANVAQALRTAGVPQEAVAAAAPAAREELARNHKLAESIEASGTPTFVVGDKVLQGAVGYEALKEAIAEARARG